MLEPIVNSLWWVNLHILPLYSYCCETENPKVLEPQYSTELCCLMWGPVPVNPVPVKKCTEFSYPLARKWFLPQKCTVQRGALFFLGPSTILSFPVPSEVHCTVQCSVWGPLSLWVSLLLMRLWIICLQPACTQQCIATHPSSNSLNLQFSENCA